MKLKKKIIIKGTLTLLSGLHIGDSKENVEIGGVDSPVIRRKDNNQPYIPGSSLKGKIRSLLEMALGEGLNSKGETSFDYDSYVTTDGKLMARLFGSAGNNGLPSRILVRDASLTAKSVKALDKSEFTDMPFTEVKFENVINRLNGTAEHPRQIERVPAGAEFEIEFVINVMEDADEEKFMALLDAGLALLQHDYLGGSGTRGYGQVAIKLNEPIHKTAEAYLKELA
jgi:CRISPR-associated protein Csm3